MQELFNISTILLWPVVCCFFYKRFDILTATFITVVGGLLLLPVKVYLDLPLLPKLDKNFVSLISVILGITIIKKKRYDFFGGLKSVRYLIYTIFFITFINFLFNKEPIFNGQYWVPGVTLYEAIAACFRNYLSISFLIVAINVVKTECDLIKLHKLLVIALIIYLPFIFIELLISPQLHNILYGFHPHSFEQQIRGGGYRPVVFIGHGLLTANIYLGGFITLLILQKLKLYIFSTTIHIFLVILFFILLIFLKSATAILLSFVALVLLYLSSDNLRKLILKCIVLFAIAYPLLVSFDLIPFDDIRELLEGIFPAERVQSLFFRFYNEKRFIEYLGDYILIGYGGLGRAMIPGAIVDGIWLVWSTWYGTIFWIIHVLLYSTYIFKTSKDRNNASNVIHIFSVLPIVVLIDQLPNSSWSQPWVWLYAGALISLTHNFYENRKNCD